MQIREGFIRDINGRAETVLERNGKSPFFEFVRISLPPVEDNHVKFRRALVRTIQTLTNINIRSTMSSGTDMLGKFYEVFLKYWNGAKEIGIVLTPRHITRFAAEVIGMDYRDVVYDPVCGTGGFLVAALEQVRPECPDDSQVEQFKLNGLFGVDQDPVVTALAMVNMILHNDGKNHIIEGNCHVKFLQRAGTGGIPTATVIGTRPAVGCVAGKAFVQTEDFATVPDDMAVLIPKGFMPLKQMYLTAALINRTNWRFSYYRKLTPTRLAQLAIPFEQTVYRDDQFVPEPRSLLPKHAQLGGAIPSSISFKLVPVAEMFNLSRGNIHNASLYSPGNNPLVSCSDRNNGILNNLDLTDGPLYRNAVTVAYNGRPLTAKYHHYLFGAKDNDIWNNCHLWCKAANSPRRGITASEVPSGVKVPMWSS